MHISNKFSKESACNTGDLGSIPGLGRSPGEWKGYPRQYFGLDNSMDCIVHEVAKSRTWLSDFHFTSLLQRKERPHYSPIETGEADWETLKVITTLQITDTAWDAVKFQGWDAPCTLCPLCTPVFCCCTCAPGFMYLVKTLWGLPPLFWFLNLRPFLSVYHFLLLRYKLPRNGAGVSSYSR